MSEPQLRPREKTGIASGTPRTVDEAKAILYEFRSEGSDKVFRLQASVARRILNEESRLEAERLQAILYAIKSLRRLRA